MAWWELILNFLLGVLTQMGYILGVQFLNLAVLWQLLPVYSSWFAIQFITRNREHEDLANRFMNGFALLWVGFELGSYLIENFAFSLDILIKTLIVSGLFIYAVFVMRLTLLKRDISVYLARIGEISAINIAALLFIQDLLVITGGWQLIQLIIGFIIIYSVMNIGFERLVDYLYTKVKLPVTEEAKPEPVPRIKRVTQQPPVTPARPIQPRRPVQPPIKPPIKPVNEEKQQR